MQCRGDETTTQTTLLSWVTPHFTTPTVFLFYGEYGSVGHGVGYEYKAVFEFVRMSIEGMLYVALLVDVGFLTICYGYEYVGCVGKAVGRHVFRFFSLFFYALYCDFIVRDYSLVYAFYGSFAPIDVGYYTIGRALCYMYVVCAPIREYEDGYYIQDGEYRVGVVACA